MKALAIDSSNYVMGVAVIEEGKVLGELITNLKKNHSVRLMPAIEEIMEEVSVKPSELDRIVVANGPGSYTGVRIGVSIAKTLAWSLGIPLVGVSSLEVLAQNGKYFQGGIVPFFDARRGQVYTGLYKKEKNGLATYKKDQIIMIEEWVEELKQTEMEYLFISNDLELHKEVIVDILGDQALFASVTDHNARPAELAFLGLNREPDTSVHAFTPNYIRLAEAEAKWLASQKK
ncbi:tRNA (adenosine(37)-N6)-threonylcarbamoyltransferase complex dimerization subunit type 1 TsaB [Pseudalkalibacillus caeni]|uniref:tRNA (Adenosine(37)-N6)-threonylcarbamoyltransferase complex dimerization subunit type 1 TsaB n=1 Tax=Exobacillus caeni TaxID=2574798 RepID=A0A5R9EXK5_9BACL|nr:tRNA (adenosine(37)-N6)-threonylcarbamoyltransferase complex dimerization subunit type 1 TsaB [Pseudalkalibacillus caeni]TLS35279.1 tRNA (adenosine(37)-N6)-threonylcarbamoyltransferase complex dimerization subunit type 1 TsaB [Pseudalkalibacillus caeni]